MTTTRWLPLSYSISIHFMAAKLRYSADKHFRRRTSFVRSAIQLRSTFRERPHRRLRLAAYI
ncbi:uncharacterized protein MYCGRDRAFT_104737 [Zymoseptoria tritici IPO323]|uniref:Uncharacterized protein n=1 Tax=Zymoseptoria tritici (strain CBS 115943 / IPO323) TaxID=336722 RepID=F9XCQ4_ZYMTI|nr:uncharacterized protein MYCGRDRAFT_104737 [Zymoseptoria tritici IPO323]EGP86923.1 hypothetical protein MYCGRDRAFT_104737 [Zymoseptoria tritici IPO323]